MNFIDTINKMSLASQHFYSMTTQYLNMGFTFHIKFYIFFAIALLGFILLFFGFVCF